MAHGHLLCPPVEGCHAVVRPWARPLSDFGVDEFLALCAAHGAPADPLGDAASMTSARRALRGAAGPVRVLTPLAPSVARAVAARLVTASLYEIVHEASDLAGLRVAILGRGAPDDAPAGLAPATEGLQVADTACAIETTEPSGTGGDGGGAGDNNDSGTNPEGVPARWGPWTSEPGQQEPGQPPPHVSLLTFPGGGGRTEANPRPIERVGAKRRKAVLHAVLAGSWLDSEAHGFPIGCGKNHMPGRGSDSDGPGPPRPHLTVIAEPWHLHTAAAGGGAGLAGGHLPGGGGPAARCFLGRLLGAEEVLRRVQGLPPPPAMEGKVTPVRPELAWALTNLAMVQPGAMVLDPFVGTGSLLAPAVALGALHTLGLDIQPAAPACPVEEAGRCGTAAVLGDRVRANARRLPFRSGAGPAPRALSARSRRAGVTPAEPGLFDAVICDPPYGLRKPRMVDGSAKDAMVSDGAEMQAAVADAMAPVVDFAASDAGLVPGGRLVFLFPTFDFLATGSRAGAGPAPLRSGEDGGAGVARRNVEDLRRVLPSHPQLRLVGICTQNFKGMSRHAVVMERAPSAARGPPAEDPAAAAPPQCTPVVNRPPVPRRDRVAAFREFLWSTFGAERLGPGTIVLDVAGGKGDLSWLLANLDGLSSVVVDPRATDHSKIARTAAWYAEHPEARAKQREQGQALASLALAPPFAIPKHLRLFCDAELLAVLAGGEPAADEWARFWDAAWAKSMAEAEAARGYHQPEPGPGPVPDGAGRGGGTVRSATEGLRLLRMAGLVLGFHPDQGTEPAVDLALQLGVPFAVVPCCAFPKSFPDRRLDGRPLENHADFVEYLRRKHPAIRTAELDFGTPPGLVGRGREVCSLNTMWRRNQVLYKL